ncbi:MAG TPA: 1-deoxy-D-xylulose-5-phosphate reductoisomerase, partial [Dehalococcoidia bacterium]
TYPAVLAAADEVAVEHFLAGRIRFTDIPRIIEDALAAHAGTADPDLETVLDADRRARARAEDWVKARA